MTSYLPVMLGGAIGAGLRFFVGNMMPLRAHWPWPTFCINLLGGLLMGALAAFVLRGAVSEELRLFAGVGILGGFTTFSAFSLEGFGMIERGQWGLAVIYGLASVVGSIAALGLGYSAVKL
jgi:fluoride exporter